MTLSPGIDTADIAILNKVDLVIPEQTAAVRSWVHAQSPRARLIDAEHGAVPVKVLLGVGTSALAEAAPEDTPPHHAHSSFDTWTFSSDQPIDRAALVDLLGALPDSVLRAIGVLRCADDPDHRVVFQMVGKRWDLSRGEPWGEETPESNLVLVGTDGSLDSVELEKRFGSVVVLAS